MADGIEARSGGIRRLTSGLTHVAAMLSIGLEVLLRPSEQNDAAGQPQSGDRGQGGAGSRGNRRGGPGSREGGQGRAASREDARGEPRTPPSREALSSGHEVTDMSARGVSHVLVAVAAAMAVVIGASAGMVWRFDIVRGRSFADLTPQQTATALPPGPHLQIHPFEDLAQLRVREERELHGYAWTSTDRSTAHIPIERAMHLMVGKSLDPFP